MNRTTLPPSMEVFSSDDKEAIKTQYRDKGCVAVYGLLSSDEVDEAIKAVDEAVEKNTLEYYPEQSQATGLNQELYFSNPLLQQLAHHPSIVAMTQEFIKGGIELQHSKLSLKPLQAGSGLVAWHQDFPFFPHTTFDLLASSVVLDDVEHESGPIIFMEGSHKLGVLDHYVGDDFVHNCTDIPNHKDFPLVSGVVPRGTVIFHHCLTLHYSADIAVSGQHRRHLVYQYRAKDTLQIAGAIRRSNGIDIDGSEPAKSVRFELPKEIKLVGARRNFFDLYGKFKPNN